MTDDLLRQVTTRSREQTIELGRTVGRKLKGGEVIELISDLGGGKTTFIKGLASGMGSDSLVTSPSFTLTNEYKSKDLTLYHYDLYRLHEAGIISQELSELMEDKKAVVVIEWPELTRDILPARRVTIKISLKSPETRLFEFNYPKDYNYLMEDID